MNAFHFEIPGRLPGLNDMVSGTGRPWWACRKTKDKAMELIGWYLRKSNVPKFSEPISIHINWVEKDARRDRDNVSSGGTKILLDAMQKYGIIVNDSRKWVKDIVHNTNVIDKKNPRVEVHIEWE